MTVGEQIAASLKLIGVLASGETAPANVAQDCLQTFSDYLDALQTQRLTIFNQERSPYSLVAGTATYTVGSGGDFNQARPIWIDHATLLINGQEYPLKMFTTGEWASVPDKSLSGQPVGVSYNANHPLGELTFYPVPDSANSYQAVLYWPSAPLVSVTALDTALSVPPGWARMLTYNLAQEFAVLFGVAVRREVAEIAQSSMADVKRTNIRPEVLTFDPALSARRGSVSSSRFDGGWF